MLRECANELMEFDDNYMGGLQSGCLRYGGVRCLHWKPREAASMLNDVADNALCGVCNMGARIVDAYDMGACTGSCGRLSPVLRSSVTTHMGAYNPGPHNLGHPLWGRMLEDARGRALA